MDEFCPMSNVRCCACGCQLVPPGAGTNADINFKITKKVATWKCPICGSFDIPDYPPRAMAIICDECARDNVPVRECVEFQGNGLVKYHDIEKLEDVSEALSKMKYYIGKKLGMSSATRNKLMLHAAREQSVN